MTIINYFKKRYLLLILVILYIVFSLLTFGDYGKTLDENMTYSNGFSLYNYWTTGKTGTGDNLLDPFIGIKDNSYSAFIYVIVTLFPGGATIDNYHLFNCLMFLPILILAYEVTFRQTKKMHFSIIAPLFILLIPRLAGDVPTNIKDLSFAILYFASLSAIYLFTNSHKKWWKMLSLVILFSLAQGFRTLGFTLYPIYGLYYIWVAYKTQTKNNTKFKVKFKPLLLSLCRELIIIFGLAFFLMVIRWPFLQTDFINNFLFVIKGAKDFIWDGKMLYMGNFILASQKPWHYLPVWLGITTPVFIMGLFTMAILFVKKYLNNALYLLFGFPILLNLFLYFILNPIIYDGPRHFIFLLPLVGMLASLIFIDLITYFRELKKGTKKIFVFLITSAVFVNILVVIIDVLNLYPYQYIYFNRLIGGLSGAYKNFETDYWGASFKEAVTWLKTNEARSSGVPGVHGEKYTIYSCADPYISTPYFTDNMIYVKDITQAEYFICYSRTNDNVKILENAGLTENAELIHTIERENVPLNFIYKISK